MILIRHGITQGNKEKRFVGRLDVPLAPEGEEMARETAPLLPAVDRLYVSPMLRCRQTAGLLWPGMEQTVIDDLRETDFGPFEGKNHEELKDDPLYQAWIGQGGGHLNFAAMPVGESAEQVSARAAEGLRLVSADMVRRGFQRAALVSHGGTIMGMLSRFGRPERDYYGWMCPNCGGFRMALDPDTLELTVLEEYRG